MNSEKRIWIENESTLIGKRNIPPNIVRQKQEATLIEIVVDVNKRIDFLTKEYGVLDKDFLKESTLKIQKRLGPEQTKNAILAIDENRMQDFIKIVLEYYDKSYSNGLLNREKDKIFTLEVDYRTEKNAAQLVSDFADKIKNNE